MKGRAMSALYSVRARALAASIGLALAVASFARPGEAASGDAALRAKLLAAYAKVASYRLTVLGSVRSSGVFAAPDTYEVTTDIEGQRVRTVIIGSTYWIKNATGNGWTKSGTTSSLAADIAGLVRDARSHPSRPFVRLPDQTQNGAKVGTFKYTAGDGASDETCNFNLKTYLATRCRQDELTILYASYNDPTIKVSKPTP
jgi:hypothetical protein